MLCRRYQVRLALSNTSCGTADEGRRWKEGGGAEVMVVNMVVREVMVTRMLHLGL